jgi:hypothetical protein
LQTRIAFFCFRDGGCTRDALSNDRAPRLRFARLQESVLKRGQVCASNFDTVRIGVLCKLSSSQGHHVGGDSAAVAGIFLSTRAAEKGKESRTRGQERLS